MTLLEIIVLALIQGLTEFLPISSSAHLILPSILLGWQDQGLVFDVAVHLGSLLAVLIYFRVEVGRMAVAWVGSLTGKGATPDSRLAWMVILATIPAVIFGLVFKSLIEEHLRAAWVIAATTLIFGAALWWADKRGARIADEYAVGWKKALIIGVAQAIAMIPGTSRSGITITAALMLGLTREAAARFSFLMSIPVILAASLLQGKDLIEAKAPINANEAGLGILLSFVSAYLCIHVFLKLLERIGMLPFVLYRLALGAVLLFMVV